MEDSLNGLLLLFLVLMGLPIAVLIQFLIWPEDFEEDKNGKR